MVAKERQWKRQKEGNKEKEMKKDQRKDRKAPVLCRSAVSASINPGALNTAY